MFSKKYILSVLALCCCLFGFSQNAKSVLKAQIAIGVNSPSSSGFVAPFEAKPINFPTVNLGVQYMFKEQLGAKFDFGFNRFSNSDESPEFKNNYSRLNLQFVYDATPLNFLPPRIGLVAHAGPGYTFLKPLGNYTDNKHSFLNLMGGLEIHYGMTDTISLFTDVSYIYGFAKDFDPATDGYGSFNGNLTTITFGISFSLSGCYYCD
ncbi:outer membrane beta-barrel protein [Subsaxibacter sp. CAU 1640]|uniref:outer membrane beta-barrel protein n=1 Tax=Subsaxibacter sp. CAU 1640 TaxID=2933271 RepID=UPI002004503C|nr:outer membrane beta-barrel protein [Subsaxibacter sp. CAU 1640]MCK7589119.1 outer membrane beta-barrel protein [Subsaxibacter sp. CAU 1640]